MLSEMLLLTGGFHFSGSGTHSFELTDSERQELADFDLRINELQQRKVSKLRELARQKGVSALKLEDLKSECGEPFVEEVGHGSSKRAIARDKANPHCPELAYLCVSEYEGLAGKDTCGWVKGEPRREQYDNIGPLCGSAGIRYYCIICGKMVGELQLVVS